MCEPSRRPLIAFLIGAALFGYVMDQRRRAEDTAAAPIKISELDTLSEPGTLIDMNAAVQMPTILVFQGTTGRIEIDPTTGYVKSTLPLDDASWLFWESIARMYPDIRKVMCQGTG